MFCQKCGTATIENALHCSNCGINHSSTVGSTRQSVHTTGYKNEGLAAVLSFFVIGLGVIYVGKIVKGVIMLLCGAFLVLFAMIVPSMVMLGSMSNPDSSGGGMGGGMGTIAFVIVFLIILTVFWVWNMIVAYKLAKEYNNYLDNTGKKPW